MSSILTGIDAINFDNAYETFKGIAEINNYEFIKFKRVSDAELEKSSKFYYFTDNTFNIEVSINSNTYLTAEIINIGVKYLEILGLEDIILKFKEIDSDLEEILENLEIDYEVDETLNSEFELSMIDSEDVEKVIGIGNTSKLEIKFESLNHMLKDYDITFNKTPLDVYIMPETKELLQDTFIIGTSLKDVGFKTEIDYSDIPLKEKVLKAKDSNTTYIIIVNEKDLKKYSVRLIDAKTEEEKVVSINTLQDELYMNF